MNVSIKTAILCAFVLFLLGLAIGSTAIRVRANIELSDRDRQYSELAGRNADLVARVADTVERVSSGLGDIKTKLSGDASSLRAIAATLRECATLVASMENDLNRLKRSIDSDGRDSGMEDN